MLAIVKSCEGWEVRNVLAGVVVAVYARLLDAVAHVAEAERALDEYLDEGGAF